MSRETKLKELAKRKSSLQKQLDDVDKEFQVLAEELKGHLAVLVTEREGYYSGQFFRAVLDKESGKVVFTGGHNLDLYDREYYSKEYSIYFSETDMSVKEYKYKLSYERKLKQQKEKRRKQREKNEA
jgi:hypothetical protein